MAATPIYASGVKNIAKTIVNADSTNWVDLFDNSTNNRNATVEGLTICSDDTSAVNMQIGLLKSGTTYVMGTVNVPTLSGTNGSAARVSALGINTLGTLTPEGIYTIEIEAGAKLQAKAVVAVTAAKTVTVTGRIRQYE